jgi:hypothetical protein
MAKLLSTKNIIIEIFLVYMEMQSNNGENKTSSQNIY